MGFGKRFARPKRCHQITHGDAGGGRHKAHPVAITQSKARATRTHSPFYSSGRSQPVRAPACVAGCHRHLALVPPSVCSARVSLKQKAVHLQYAVDPLHVRCWATFSLGLSAQQSMNAPIAVGRQIDDEPGWQPAARRQAADMRVPSPLHAVNLGREGCASSIPDGVLSLGSGLRPGLFSLTAFGGAAHAGEHLCWVRSAKIDRPWFRHASAPGEYAGSGYFFPRSSTVSAIWTNRRMASGRLGFGPV
jgi:hypothetical protein